LSPEFQIAKYAYGEDYHFVIKDKLKIFMQQIQKELGDVNGRAFVDSAPLHERAWAAKSGLGWMARILCFLTKVQEVFSFGRIGP